MKVTTPSRSVCALRAAVRLWAGLWLGTAGLLAHSAEAPDPAPHASDTATIRLHHLNRLEARLTTDSGILKAQCRYESDITTPPPPRHIALTFDDGPEAGQTEFILETLRQYGVPATFFMIGAQAEKHPELVRQVLAAGVHQIANHSWDHPNFHSISAEQQASEVVRTETALDSAMHKKLFRYPYGNASCETNALLHTRGYQIVGWHVDSCDWAFDKDGRVDFKEATTCGVLPQYRSDFTGHVLSALRAHNGGILLMHEIHPNTLKKLGEIIQAALADGFVFDTLDSPGFASSMR